MSSPGQRVVARTLPHADVLEHRAAIDVPVVHRGHPLRVEHVAAVAPGERGERHRRVGRPECGDAEVLHRRAEQFGRDARGDDAGRLALIVGGADRRVALDVLHRAHACAHRADQVGHCRVALHVDELAGRGIRVGHVPQHDAGGLRRSSDHSRPQRVPIRRRSRARRPRMPPPRRPLRRHPGRSNTPSAEPATLTASSGSPGTNAPMASS